MRIGVDCRLAGVRHAGIGRYIENLIQKLPTQAPEFEWVFFFADAEQAKTVLGPLLKHPKLTVVYAPIRHYSLAEQLKMPGIFAQANLDLLHVPHFNVPIFYRGKVVVTIHDLLWHQRTGTGVTTLPGWQYWLKYLGYRLVTRVAITRALKIMVPAQTIADAISQHFPAQKHKLVVTPEGIAESFATHLPQRQQPTPKRLLYVGSLYPHKNIEVVLQALLQLPEYELWLVGARNIFQDDVKKRVAELGLTSRVTFKGYVADNELVKLFDHCLCLVQPSLSEGFGLTGVEAMAAGLPVIASNLPIFREVYGKHALLCDPHQPAAFVAAIQDLATLSTASYKKWLAEAQALTKRYNWDNLTAKTLATYLTSVAQT